MLSLGVALVLGGVISIVVTVRWHVRTKRAERLLQDLSLNHEGVVFGRIMPHLYKDSMVYAFIIRSPVVSQLAAGGHQLRAVLRYGDYSDDVIIGRRYSDSRDLADETGQSGFHAGGYSSNLTQTTDPKIVVAVSPRWNDRIDGVREAGLTLEAGRTRILLRPQTRSRWTV
jgi:hypothetical protein